MPTRSCVHFRINNKTQAIIYVHDDGYPEHMEPELLEFLNEVDNDLKDKRFNDPTYLAAKYLVWKAQKYIEQANEIIRKLKFRNGISHPLDFLGVGVCLKDPGDIEYRYFVDCDNEDKPKITYEYMRRYN